MLKCDSFNRFLGHENIYVGPKTMIISAIVFVLQPFQDFCVMADINVPLEPEHWREKKWVRVQKVLYGPYEE